MKLSKAEVEYVARLARLEFSEQEKEIFTTQLNSILDYVGKLGELDTSGVSPTAHVMDLTNAFREDVVGPSLSPDEALSNAPEHEDDFFVVPKVI
ncbi:MAG: Asp-tRNA(Asn)/Glu-tRNA(Gln) amidotransferase subunit GatC [Pseudomonadota bacterium]